MRARLGLQAKMTASYVLVTAAAVALVEVVVLAVVVPAVVSRSDRLTVVQRTAQDYADAVTGQSATLGRLPNDHEVRLGDPAVRLGPGEAQLASDRASVRIPYTTTRQDDARPMSLALLLDTAGRVVASSYPARYRVGDTIGGAGLGIASSKAGMVETNLAAAALKGAGTSTTPSGEVIWASAPVLRLAAGGQGFEVSVKPDPKSPPSPTDLLGAVYVQVPASADLAGLSNPLQASTALSIGVLVLLGALPVGVVFGLLSTRRLIGRLRRLAATTVAVADGDFGQRVPLSGGDEVAQLERNFNRMAERLDDSMAAERQLAGAGERARIARELHDSISQELFSLHLLAGGLRKALPPDSPLHSQVETMEATTTATMQEMQALLLELRPIALAGAGLVPALEELSRAYRERLGVSVDADLTAVRLAPPVEHAVFRIAQEALANAVKHARPAHIWLRLEHQDGQTVVTVEDDGDGFDPTRAEERHGMGLQLMRERVAEVGGTLQLDTGLAKGTRVRVVLPGERP